MSSYRPSIHIIPLSAFVCASLAGLVLSFIAYFVLLVIAPLPAAQQGCSFVVKRDTKVLQGASCGKQVQIRSARRSKPSYAARHNVSKVTNGTVIFLGNVAGGMTRQKHVTCRM